LKAQPKKFNIGEETMKGSSYDLVALEPIKVKGKEKSIKIYTILG
jgi:hypothetical protein